ncbi:MAG: bifunctional class I SAM-dependent methyltransferase/glycosyltransferase family 2 protein [Verrucomicrobia bacterium]|nr:bifunctional class I SAM-dependent methyltransferase/glycosyltransferase family 2 protein [Verrucomicrobiota bacterium]
MHTLGKTVQQHLLTTQNHFDNSPDIKPAAFSYRCILAHYYNLLIPENASVLEIGCGGGDLLIHLNSKDKTGIDASITQINRAKAKLPDARFEQQFAECLKLNRTYDYIIISDTLNFVADAQLVFEQLSAVATPETRLILNFHNNLWHPIHSIASSFGFRRHNPSSSWLSPNDIENLLELSSWESIKRQSRIFWPLNTPVIAALFNRYLLPFLPWASFSVFEIARLRPKTNLTLNSLSVSVIIPARNEAGNIEAAVLRTPQMGKWTELIFVEGHSKDNTWDEIERVKLNYPDLKIKTMRQTGKGKGNAVREGFAAASGDILMILDADLTMPPEELPKFYSAVAEGKAEFANGSRLVYPMEKGAMQFLNMIANKFFGLAFSWLLGQNIKDTLCGTKVLRRDHYLRIADNRAYFGEFDPFGDFDLLFGADKLNLKIRDIPIRYRERTYGSTNIHRWKHGALLLRMLVFAARKIKFI